MEEGVISSLLKEAIFHQFLAPCFALTIGDVPKGTNCSAIHSETTPNDILMHQVQLSCVSGPQISRAVLYCLLLIKPFTDRTPD